MQAVHKSAKCPCGNQGQPCSGLYYQNCTHQEESLTLYSALMRLFLELFPIWGSTVHVTSWGTDILGQVQWKATSTVRGLLQDISGEHLREPGLFSCSYLLKCPSALQINFMNQPRQESLSHMSHKLDSCTSFHNQADRGN